MPDLVPQGRIAVDVGRRALEPEHVILVGALRELLRGRDVAARPQGHLEVAGVVPFDHAPVAGRDRDRAGTVVPDLVPQGRIAVDVGRHALHSANFLASRPKSEHGLRPRGSREGEQDEKGQNRTQLSGHSRVLRLTVTPNGVAPKPSAPKSDAA